MKNLAPHGVPVPTETTFAVIDAYCGTVTTALVRVPVEPPVVLPVMDTLLEVGNPPACNDPIVGLSAPE